MRTLERTWRALARTLRRSQGIILAYHNVVPEKGARNLRGERSLHVRADVFREQLDWLQKRYRVTSLPELLSAPSRDAVAITFDDAYRGAVRIGVRELVERGMPGTLFVAPGLLGNQCLWWDVLSEAVSAGGRIPERERALVTHRGEGDAVLQHMIRPAERRRALRRLDASYRTASFQEVSEAASHPGIAVAPHSWGHSNLSVLGMRDVEREVVKSLAWIRRHFPSEQASYLAYPYGLVPDDAENLLERVGVSAAFLSEGGRVPADWWQADRFRIPRINIPSGLSKRRFALRCSGLT